MTTVRSGGLFASERLPSDHPILRAIGRTRNELFVRRVRRALPTIVRSIPHAVLAETDRDVLALTRTGTSVAIATLGSGTGGPAALVLIPQTPAARALLRRQVDVQQLLGSDQRLRAWAHRIPRALADGETGGLWYVVDEVLPGRDPRPLLEEARSRAELLGHAADVIRDFHERTGESSFVGPAHLARWVEQPIRTILESLAAAGRGAQLADAFEAIAVALRDGLADRVLPVSWIHGDYWPGNLLVDPEGRITGVVDWDRAEPDQLGIQDLLHLVLYTRALVRQVEPGVVVREVLAGPDWSRDERAILRGWEDTTARAGVDRECVILVYWLRFVAATFEQSDYFARHPRWVRENVESVLAAVPSQWLGRRSESSSGGPRG